jgi:3-oxoacyl-[acyl-carrier protein] reductase
VLPRFSPETSIGRPAVHAYAARAGQSVEEYLKSIVQSGGPLVSPETAGAAMVALVQEDPANVAPAYLLSGNGLKKLA